MKENEISPRVLDMLRKVHALAKDGVGGEKENAVKLLNKLLAKYRVTLEDIEQPTVEFEYFKIPTHPFKDSFKTLIVQCIFAGTEIIKRRGEMYTVVRRKGRFVKAQITASESILVREMILHYWKAFVSIQDDFVHAFVHANKLYSESEDNDDESPEPRQMSQEEEARRRRIAQMTGGIERNSFQRRIGKGK